MDKSARSSETISYIPLEEKNMSKSLKNARKRDAYHVLKRHGSPVEIWRKRLQKSSVLGRNLFEERRVIEIRGRLIESLF